MSITPSSRSKGKGRFALGCFFTFFMLFGLAMSAVFLWPLAQIYQANNWRQVPCTILESRVESHSGSKGGSTYSVEVKYEYFIDDVRHVGDRYKFMGGSSSGYDGKKAIVDKLAPGTQTNCYVNRRDPNDSVIERGFTADILFGFIPLIFALIGAGGLFGVFVYKQKFPRPRAITAGAGMPAGSPPRAGAAKLKTSSSRIGRLILSIVFAAFWNAIVSVFLFSCISGWRSGSGDGCMTAFLMPFVLVGIGLMVLVAYFFLGLFNPSPTLKLNPAVVALGDSVEVEWETTGNVDRVKSFKITLEGREEATYKRGTSTSTDKSVFLKLDIVDSPRGKDLRRGKGKFQIPADSMHTFISKHNKIIWSLSVKGDIPMWPDINEEFPLEVQPHRNPAGGPA
jgi:hypothetical protein